MSEARIVFWPRTPNEPFLSAVTEGLRSIGVRHEPFRYRYLLQRNVDAACVHWPERCVEGRVHLVNAIRFLDLALMTALCRLRGIELVTFAHNLGARNTANAARVRWILARWFTLADEIVIFSPGAKRRLLRDFPAVVADNVHVIPTVDYRERFDGAVPPGLVRAPGRLCTFGNIRPFKNVEGVIRAFREIEDPGVRLAVLGKPGNDDIEMSVRAAVGGDARVELHLERVTDQELAIELHRSSIAVFAFKSFENSGSATAALGQGCPVLVPDLPASKDLQDRFGVNAVRQYKNTLSGADIMAALLTACPPKRSNAGSARSFARSFVDAIGMRRNTSETAAADVS